MDIRIFDADEMGDRVHLHLASRYSVDGGLGQGAILFMSPLRPIILRTVSSTHIDVESSTSNRPINSPSLVVTDPKGR